MNSLDSRSLSLGDTFAQKFSRPCLVRYRIGSAASGLFALEQSFTIAVNPAGAKRKAKQHNVVVRLEGRKLTADPPSLEIEAGDMVLWSVADATTPGFRVSGQFEGGAFDSSALTQEAVYSHAFGSAGEYDWVDANSNSVGGKVIVTDPKLTTDQHLKDYRKTLSTGTLVLIRGDRAEPECIEIHTGQAVFWAVEKAGGITITDRRLKLNAPAPRPFQRQDV